MDDDNKDDSFWWSTILGIISGSFAFAWLMGGNIFGAFFGSSFSSDDSSSNDDEF